MSKVNMDLQTNIETTQKINPCLIFRMFATLPQYPNTIAGVIIELIKQNGMKEVQHINSLKNIAKARKLVTTKVRLKLKIMFCISLHSLRNF